MTFIETELLFRGGGTPSTVPPLDHVLACLHPQTPPPLSKAPSLPFFIIYVDLPTGWHHPRARFEAGVASAVRAVKRPGVSAPRVTPMSVPSTLRLWVPYFGDSSVTVTFAEAQVNCEFSEPPSWVIPPFIQQKRVIPIKWFLITTAFPYKTRPRFSGGVVANSCDGRIVLVQ